MPKIFLQKVKRPETRPCGLKQVLSLARGALLFFLIKKVSKKINGCRQNLLNPFKKKAKLSELTLWGSSSRSLSTPFSSGLFMEFF